MAFLGLTVYEAGSLAVGFVGTTGALYGGSLAVGHGINSWLEDAVPNPEPYRKNLTYLSGDKQKQMDLGSGAGIHFGNDMLVSSSSSSGRKTIRMPGSRAKALLIHDTDNSMDVGNMEGNVAVLGSSHTKLGNKNMAKKYARKGTRKTKRTKQYGRMVRVQGVKWAPEIKHFDMSTTAFTVTADGFWQMVALSPLVVQGTDFLNRIGRRIMIHRMELMMHAKIVTVANVPIGGDMIRCDVWHDNECKGVLPGAATVYDVTVTTNPKPLSPPNAAYLKRFKLLASSAHNVSVTSVAGGIVTGANVSEMAKMKFRINKPVNFTLTTSASIAEIIDNNWYIACASVSTTPAGTCYSFEVLCRYFFSDF